MMSRVLESRFFLVDVKWLSPTTFFLDMCVHVSVSKLATTIKKTYLKVLE